jgi:serine/threonine protein kinase
MLTTTTATASGREVLGTYAWSAPEVVIDGQKHTEKSDVYSFALVMWELLTCEVPFSDCGPMQMRARLINHQRPDIPNPLPSGFPPAYLELMIRCWHQVMA